MKEIGIILIIVLPVIVTLIWIFSTKRLDAIVEVSTFELSDRAKFLSDIEEFCKNKKWKLSRQNKAIFIKTRLSIYSYGEYISINFFKENDKEFIKISSKPKVRTTRVDYNQNKLNVKEIAELVSK